MKLVNPRWVDDELARRIELAESATDEFEKVSALASLIWFQIAIALRIPAIVEWIGRRLA